ncbi:MAG: hypothetical protein AABY34_04935 [Pseudomonadota bacterium]
MKKRLATLLFLALTCALLAGCLNAKYAARTQYAFEVNQSVRAPLATNTNILEVTSVNIEPKFSGISFIYRLSTVNYTNDFYNVFITPPAAELRHVFANYFDRTGLFQHVIDAQSLAQPNYILVTKVLELYADYRNKAQPTAVMTIQFILMKPIAHKNPEILIHKTFHEAIPLKNKDSESLMHAWNVGLTKILHQLTVQFRIILNT